MHIRNQAKWLALPLLLLPVAAQADTSVGFQVILKSFKAVTQGWYTALFADALGLFAALFTIEIVWMVTKWLITGKDVHEIFSSFVKKLLSIGFFFSILVYSNQLFPDLINGFKAAASSAGGPPVTTVSDITMTALRAFVVCVEAGPVSAAKGVGAAASDLWNWNFSGAASALGNAASAAITSVLGVNTLVGILVGFILLLAFIYLALEIFAVQLEAMLVMGAGVIMLGFGGSSLTTRFTESYMQYALSVGVRLMILMLWGGFVEWKVNPLIKTILTQGGAGMQAYGVVLILALLVGWLTKKLQGIASSILSGSSSLSGGEIAGGIMKGVALATAAVATGGAAAAGLIGSGAAAGLSEATGAAGSNGAGDLGAASTGGGTSGGPSGAQAPASAPASGTTSGGGASGSPAGAPAPALPASTTTSGGANHSGPKASPSPVSGSSGGSSGSAAAPEATTKDVDHRASTPNEALTSGSQTSGKGTPAPDTQPASGEGEQQSSKNPSFMDVAKRHEKKMGQVVEHLSPGDPSTGAVQAPSMGAKHLSD